MSFATAHPGLAAALQKRSYTSATPVQSAVLEAETDKDLLVSAQTGSGKTVAFGLGIAPTLLGAETRFARAGAPLALVVTPTRELAQQVHRELSWLYAETGARISTCVGGFDPRREQHALAQGVHIVVGTPGRLCDHLERGALVLDRIAAVVLDEADEMLDMGFREDIERLLDATPATRRTLLFSATIPKDIAAMAKRYQKSALRIATQSEHDRHRDIEYRAIPIVPRERELAVVNVLRYHEAPGALVFCATRDGVTHLAAGLAERGFSVAALSGELSQRERNQALQALRDRRARVCVATDVAARGLDLPDLGLVIHADLPQNAQALVHRSGRTGRAGKRGLSIVLVPDMARRYAERMLRSANVDAQWMRGPTADEILERDSAALVAEIGGLAAEIAEDDREVAKQLLADRPAEDLVAALVRLRREMRPAPEELTLPPSMRPRGNERFANARPERPERHGRDERLSRDDRGSRNDRGRHDDRSRFDERPRFDAAPRHDERPRAAEPVRVADERPRAAEPTRVADERPVRSWRDKQPARDIAVRYEVEAAPADAIASADAPRADHQAPVHVEAAAPSADENRAPARDDAAPPAAAPTAKPPREERARRTQRDERAADEQRPQRTQRDERPAVEQRTQRTTQRTHRDDRSPRNDRRPLGFGTVRSPATPDTHPVPSLIDALDATDDNTRGRGRRRGPNEPLPHAGASWFTINVGRSKNADPKWLVPLLCRRGGITKRDIGKIQIFQRETRVEISAEARERFAEAVRVPDSQDRNIQIEPVDFEL